VTTVTDAAKPRPASIAIVLEGGLIRSVISRDPAMASPVVIIDFDVDEEDTNATVTDPDGDTARAMISIEHPEQADIALAFAADPGEPEVSL
jgi:hypothetical protein